MYVDVHGVFSLSIEHDQADNLDFESVEQHSNYVYLNILI